MLNEIKKKIEKDGGCLCYVWNKSNFNPNKRIMIVRKINKETKMFNDGWSCVFYEFAEPIMLKEIEIFIKG